MSLSENISFWKKRSEIDYITLFISLWVSLNMWMKSRWELGKDRKLINALKRLDNEGLKNQFIDLIRGNDSKSLTFKGHFGELHSALENANLEYDSRATALQNAASKKVSFSNCIIDWNDGNFELDSVVKKATDPLASRIEIASNFFVEGNNDRLFAAYIEILYQVRCLLFHGNLWATQENIRVIKHLYLTLSMIMVRI